MTADWAIGLFALMLWGAGFLFVSISAGIVSLIEAYVLQALLKLGFRRSFWYAFAANVVSATVGFVIFLPRLLREVATAGWKTYLVDPRWGPLTGAFVLSFVITVVVEGLVLWLLLRKWANPARIAKATVAMNALSYGVTAVVMIIGMLSVAASK